MRHSPARPRPGPAVPVAEEHDLGHEVDARRPRDGGTHLVDEAADVRRAALPVVDDEVRVLLARPSRRRSCRPFRPAALDELARPTAPSAGFRNVLPADGMPSGWWAWRQRRMSSRRSLISSGVAGSRRKRAPSTISAGSASPGWCLNRLSRYARPSSSTGSRASVPSARRTSADSRTALTSEPWAPALAQTAPPTVPGTASPNSSPDSPAFWVSVAARAIGTPASATYVAPSTRLPSARTWTTRPRMPRSEITTLLPRPMSVSGRSRDRAKRMSARSSKPLWAVTRRSAGPPTRIVVSFASGALRSAFTPDAARDVAAEGDEVELARPRCVTRRSPRRPRRRAGVTARRRVGQRPPLGEGEQDLGDRVRRAGPGHGPRRRRHRGVPRRVVEERDRVEQRRRRRTPRPRRAAPRPRPRAPRRSPAGARRRAGTARRRSAARTRRPRQGSTSPRARPRGRPRRGPRAAPRRGTPRAGSATRIAAGSVARAASARCEALRPGDVDDDGPLDEPRAAPPATASLRRRTACEPPKITTSRASAGMPRRSRAARRSTAATSRIGVPVTKQRLPGRERRAGRLEAERRGPRPAARSRGRSGRG